MRIEFLLIGLIGIFGVAMTANAKATLVLGLLDIAEGQDSSYVESLDYLERGLEKRRCKLVREGQVASSNGELLAQKFKRFFLIHCRQSLIGDPENLGLFEFPGVEHQDLMLLEGRTDDVKFPSNRVVQNRLYIIKVGRYNNADPTTRYLELDAINEMAGSRSPTFKSEAFFFVDTAYGVERPDEVTVIYYPDPAAAQQFRSNNGDVLNRIGKFNSDHLSGFNYLNTTSNR